MKIHIKKRTQSEIAMWLIIVLPFLFGLLNEFLGLPWAVRYTIDIAWLFLLVLLLKFNRQVLNANTKQLLLHTITFLLITLVVYLFHFQSPLYYLWGFRNNFRFFFVTLLFASFLKKANVSEYFELFEKLFWLNAAISFVQYAMGYKGDHLGGLFGVLNGANGYTNIYFCIMVTHSAVRYMEKKESLANCAAVCVTALLIAALAELKFFFVEFILIFGLSALFTNFSIRKIFAVAGGMAAVMLFATLLEIVFPNFSGFLSIDWFLQAGTTDKGYTSSGDLNRLNAISQINELWLTTWPERLFGLGLGNCDTATYAFLNTPFFEENGYMHYTWLSYAFMYLECGWIGLIFYFDFFVLIYFKAAKIQKRVSGDGVTYCRLARIMAVLCAVISIYNSSLRTEAGYMAYFVLSIPFVFDREMRMKELRRREIA